MDYFLTTIAIPTASLILIIVKILTDRYQLQQARKALQENTDLTKKGIATAAVAADHAADAVTVAKASAAETKEALNGRIDQMIQAAVSAALAKAKLQKDPT